MKKVLLLITLVLSLSAAKLPENFYKYDDEFKEAEVRSKVVPFFLLKAIAMTENDSFDPNIKRLNSNNTYDYGLMQVNTIWLDAYGVDEDKALTPRQNIHMSAKILASIIKQYGYSWESIGRYHSATPKYKQIWLAKLKKNLLFIIKNDTKNNYVIEA
jgi:soluble lytic murein transglycosylase-like protein